MYIEGQLLLQIHLCATRTGSSVCLSELWGITKANPLLLSLCSQSHWNTMLSLCVCVCVCVCLSYWSSPGSVNAALWERNWHQHSKVSMLLNSFYRFIQTGRLEGSAEDSCYHYNKQRYKHTHSGQEEEMPTQYVYLLRHNEIDLMHSHLITWGCTGVHWVGYVFKLAMSLP